MMDIGDRAESCHERICGVNACHDQLVLLSGVVFETEDRSIEFAGSPQYIPVAGFCLSQSAGSEGNERRIRMGGLCGER
jgi:hypothetical protein